MKLRHLLLAIVPLAVTLGSTPVHAGRDCDKTECREVKAAIREIESRMRNGYTAAQGIRYDEKLRKLKDKRYKVCC